MRKYYFLGYSLIVLFKGAFNRRNTNAAFGTAFEDGPFFVILYIYKLYI